MDFKEKTQRNSEKKFRTFIAVKTDSRANIQLDRELELLFAELSATTKSRPRRIPANNRHLTLSFLGDVTQELRSQLPDTLAWLQHTPAFQLEFTRIKHFPDRHSRVIAALPDTDSPATGNLLQLRTLQLQIVESLAPLMLTHHLVPPKMTGYRPHISLAKTSRFRTCNDELKLPQKIPPCIVPISAVGLFDSKLTPTGSVYSLLHCWSLSAGSTTIP